MALLLPGCSAGGSARCWYDWNYTEVCEVRAHHPLKPGTFAIYAYEDGKLIPLYAEESSSVLSVISSLVPVPPLVP